MANESNMERTVERAVATAVEKALGAALASEAPATAPAQAAPLPVEYIELKDPGTWMPGMGTRTTTRSAYIHRSTFRILFHPDTRVFEVTAREGDTLGTYSVSIPVENAWQYRIETKPLAPPVFPEPPEGAVHAGQIPIAKRMGS